MARWAWAARLKSRFLLPPPPPRVTNPGGFSLDCAAAEWIGRGASRALSDLSSLTTALVRWTRWNGAADLRAQQRAWLRD